MALPTGIDKSQGMWSFDVDGKLVPFVTPTPWVATPQIAAANAKASITQAAPGAGKRLVCTSLTATIAATSTAPAAVQLSVSLKDEDANVLWSGVLSLTATAGDRAGVTPPGLYLPAAEQNKALTLEFSAAGGANTVEAVSMSGEIVTW